jgi:hypothetical protein
MIRQSLMLVSALIVMLVAGLLAGCENQTEDPAPSSPVTAASEAGEAQDEAAEGADKSAKAHDMDMEGNNQQDMDMQAGEDLRGSFAHKELVVLDDPVEAPAEFTAALGQMHQHYRDMAQAFVADDAEAADAAAQKMREQVESVSVEGLNAEAKDAWDGHRKVMRTSLHQLTKAEDIEGKREHFSHISEAMYCALKSFGRIDQKVHVAFCPMAIDGNGAYWLADKAEIENPYMGQKMASCGEVKETIN